MGPGRLQTLEFSDQTLWSKYLSVLNWSFLRQLSPDSLQEFSYVSGPTYDLFDGLF